MILNWASVEEGEGEKKKRLNEIKVLHVRSTRLYFLLDISVPVKGGIGKRNLISLSLRRVELSAVSASASTGP